MKRGHVALFALGSALACTAWSVPSDACGGAFFETPEVSTVHVTGHKMAISVSDAETLIWDQLTYTGNPTEFAFVFPAPPTATLALSSDPWFEALDLYSAPTIYSPRSYSREGCALMGCGASEDETSGTASAAKGGTQATIGPYLVTTIAAKTPDDLISVLTSAGFSVPAGVSDAVAAYIAAGMNFYVLRLRPGCGEQALQPIRVTIPGSHPTVPMRLANADVNGLVNIEVFTLGTTRFAPSNYPTTTIDPSLLRTNADGSSNYEDVVTAALAAGGGGDGTAWLTEYAGSPYVPANYGTAPVTAEDSLKQGLLQLHVMDNSGDGADASLASGDTLATFYDSICTGVSVSGCSETPDASLSPDATDPFFDGSAIDAQSGVVPEAGPDAGVGDDEGDEDAGDASVMILPRPLNVVSSHPTSHPPNNASSPTCGSPSDLDRVNTDTPPAQLVMTRLRAKLPAAAILQADLELTPSTAGDVSQYYQAIAASGEDPPISDPAGSCKSTPSRRPRADAWGLVGAVAFGIAALLRRRSRK